MGFLDQMKQGGQRAAWEAERLVRQQKASAAVSDARRDVEAQIFALGKAVMQSYAGGATPPPEAAPIYEQVMTLDARVKQLEEDLERIKQEQPPQPAPQPAPQPPPAPSGYAPSPAAGYTPPPAAAGGYTPTGPAPGGYSPTGPAPMAGYMPSGPAPMVGSYTPPAMSSDISSAAFDDGASMDADDVAVDDGDSGPVANVFCQNCGTRRKDPTAAFCQECGTRYTTI